MARLNTLMTRLLIALAFLLVAGPAVAQWQVPNHAVPVGKGPGFVGFSSAAPSSAGNVMLDKGASADPAFVTLGGDVSSISGSGSVTLDTELHCLASLTSAADKLPYFSGLGTCALSDFPASQRTYLTTPSSANLRAVLNDETGTGLAYFQGGALGTPLSGTLTNATGLPIAGITGLGTNIGTWLATPSSANLAAAITDETGTGALVFGTAPQISTIELGAASDTTISRTGAGDIAIEGNAVYRAGGTDVALADGGTGSSTAPGARVNLKIDQATSNGDSNYSILATDRTVITSATLTAARTWTLPAANAVNAGQHLVVADLFGGINGANTLTVQRAGADTINGVTSAALTAQYGYVDLVSDGVSKWTYQAAAGGGSGTVTNATIAAGFGLSSSGTCTITTSGTCTLLASSALANNAPVNAACATSVSSNALTIALKGNDGNDPSATNPVYIPFRSATAATGTQDLLTATAATSLVISSGSTMGFTSASIGRIWVVAFDDAGTLRLGAVNALSGTSIMPLRDNVLSSSTAEGGAGAADNAQTIYTGTAVTSKGMRILCYLEATEAAAGTWATAPSLVQMAGPSVPQPGDVVQIVRTDAGAVATGTTTIPRDNTIPQSTEGDQYMSQAITPSSGADLLRVETQAEIATSADSFTNTALFRDSGANAVATTSNRGTGSNSATQHSITYDVKAGSTSSTTFKLRGGSPTAGTTTFNGESGSAFYNGTYNSFMIVEEIMG